MCQFNSRLGPISSYFLITTLDTLINGAVVLSRNNVPSISYYYGVVRVYYNGWGNICDDYYYNSAEANVICHQLGYTGASSYSRAGLVRYVRVLRVVSIEKICALIVMVLTTLQ